VPVFLAFDVIICVIFLLYCFVEATRVLKGRIARIKQRWKKFIGIDGTSKPGFVGRTIRKLLPEKPNNGEDLIVIRSEKHPLENGAATRSGAKHPFTIELLDPGTNKIRPVRSCSAASSEESHRDLRLRSLKSTDDHMMKIFSVRDTETGLLNSYRAGSRRGSLHHQPILPSQILDLDDENKGDIRAGSMLNIVLDIMLQEAPTAALNKDMLKDERFKEIDKVEISQDNADLAHAKLKIESLKDERFKDIDRLEIHNEAVEKTTTAAELPSPVMESEEEKAGDQEENLTRKLRKEMLKDERFKDLDKVEIQFEDEQDKGVVRKIPIFTEEDEMVPLSALKDEDFKNSIDTNSLDIEIQREEEATRANNVKNEPNSSEESHEVLSLSVIDPIQSGRYDDEEREGEIQANEVSNTRNESSENPDVMTLSGVFGRYEPHSAA